MIKKLFVFVASLSFLFAEPVRHGWGEREIYYFEAPENRENYPLLLVIEGSFDIERGPESILRLQKKFGELVLPMGVGVLTVEKRGVDGNEVDLDEFHRCNTVTNRFKQHLELINRLEKDPPIGWNGKLAILGGSEGSAVAIKLAEKVMPSACIAIVPQGNQTFKEYVWGEVARFPGSMRADLLSGVEGVLPGSKEAFESQIELMKREPDPFRFWFGQSYLYWTDAAELGVEKEFLNLSCPAFVITGSEDLGCPSTDHLVQIAIENGQQVIYLKVEGMGHDALDPKWEVMPHIQMFLTDVLL